jgi:hypothetical protein
MLSKKQSTSQLGFYSTFEEQLSHKHPLYILANKINWDIFQEAFAKLLFRRRSSCKTDTVDGVFINA